MKKVFLSLLVLICFAGCKEREIGLDSPARSFALNNTVESLPSDSLQAIQSALIENGNFLGEQVNGFHSGNAELVLTTIDDQISQLFLQMNAETEAYQYTKSAFVRAQIIDKRIMLVQRSLIRYLDQLIEGNNDSDNTDLVDALNICIQTDMQNHVSLVFIIARLLIEEEKYSQAYRILFNKNYEYQDNRDKVISLFLVNAVLSNGFRQVVNYGNYKSVASNVSIVFNQTVSSSLYDTLILARTSYVLGFLENRYGGEYSRPELLNQAIYLCNEAGSNGASGIIRMKSMYELAILQYKTGKLDEAMNICNEIDSELKPLNDSRFEYIEFGFLNRVLASNIYYKRNNRGEFLKINDSLIKQLDQEVAADRRFLTVYLDTMDNLVRKLLQAGDSDKAADYFKSYNSLLDAYQVEPLYSDFDQLKMIFSGV